MRIRYLLLAHIIFSAIMGCVYLLLTDGNFSLTGYLVGCIIGIVLSTSGAKACGAKW